ncbi:MAG: cysteine-rich small domain-containing protein [Anaerovoracaceae bacterium]
MENYKFFNNNKCEYFPCHNVKEKEKFNCLFCFCPLYALGDKCGGNFKFMENGTKDCSNCLIPHTEGSYDYIMKKWPMICDLAKNKE